MLKKVLLKYGNLALSSRIFETFGRFFYSACGSSQSSRIYVGDLESKLLAAEADCCGGSSEASKMCTVCALLCFGQPVRVAEKSDILLLIPNEVNDPSSSTNKKYFFFVFRFANVHKSKILDQVTRNLSAKIFESTRDGTEKAYLSAKSPKNLSVRSA